MEIFEKRGRWCLRDEAGKLHKFNTEAEANSFAKEGVIDGSEEKEEDSEEKASSY